MNWKSVIVVSAVVASAALCMAMKRREAAELSASAKSERSAAEALASVRVENQQMAVLLEKAAPGDALSQGRLVELMRLRSSVGKLRETVAQKPRLEAANARWRELETKKREDQEKAEAAPNYWTKERLAFCGWATPEASMQSLLWAMKNGDARSWQSECTPEAWAGLAEELNRSGKRPEEPEAAVENMGREMVAASSGFHIVGQEMVGSDEAVIELSFDGEDAIRRFGLKKMGNDWRFDSLGLAGQASLGR